jgi:hypothetical protein
MWGRAGWVSSARNHIRRAFGTMATDGFSRSSESAKAALMSRPRNRLRGRGALLERILETAASLPLVRPTQAGYVQDTVNHRWLPPELPNIASVIAAIASQDTSFMFLGVYNVLPRPGPAFEGSHTKVYRNS